MKIGSVIVFVLFASAAMANDGFFQGSGYNLVQVTDQNLRVVSEDLEISPIFPEHCFPVLYDGTPLKKEYPSKIDKKKIKMGNQVDCDSLKKMDEDILLTHWKAKAEYKVTAARDEKDVQIGFPVPSWQAEFTIKDDGLDGVTVPGVAKFKTFMDGQEVTDVDQKQLKMKVAFGLGEESTTTNLSGYSWKESFKAGEDHDLKTEYEFGVDTSAGYYEGREYPTGVKPWFFKNGETDITHVEALLYYVSPITTWAEPPPDHVKIHVVLPEGLPVNYVVPVGMKPTCIEKHGLFFNFKHEFPKGELDLTYPTELHWLQLQPMKTQQEFDQWSKSLGKKNIKMECALTKSLAKEIKTPECVESCD